jgi:hypothetical protein
MSYGNNSKDAPRAAACIGTSEFDEPLLPRCRCDTGSLCGLYWLHTAAIHETRYTDSLLLKFQI